MPKPFESRLDLLLELAHQERNKLREHLDLGSETWKDATPRDFDVWCKRRDELKANLAYSFGLIGSKVLHMYEEGKLPDEVLRPN
jgi:hypothetical protein